MPVGAITARSSSIGRAVVRASQASSPRILLGPEKRLASSWTAALPGVAATRMQSRPARDAYSRRTASTRPRTPDRKAAFELLERIIPRLEVAPEVRLFGEATVYEAAPLADALSNRLSHDGEAALLVPLRGDPGEWELAAWPLAPVLERWGGRGRTPVLIVDGKACYGRTRYAQAVGALGPTCPRGTAWRSLFHPAFVARGRPINGQRDRLGICGA